MAKGLLTPGIAPRLAIKAEADSLEKVKVAGSSRLYVALAFEVSSGSR